MPEFHVGILLILGIGAFGGVLGAWLFQRFRVPQVMGYIVLGLIIGQTGLKIVNPEHIRQLHSFNLFALGMIGFLVGGELQFDTFRRYGRQFAMILLGEGIAAFLLVGVLTGGVIFYITGTVAIAVAGGVVFGAIASATDPASTMDVLWEYRSGGVLTTAIIAIIALDDALAMILYGLGTSVAAILTGGDADVGHELLKVCIELVGAVVLGCGFGYVLYRIMKRIHDTKKSLAISIGTILLVIGIAVRANMDVILATMTLGLTLINLAPRRSKELFELVRTMSVPIYVLFFVLVGARLSLSSMPGWLWLIVGLYVVGRTAGKMGGAWWGARITGAEPVVRRYMGLGLFAQGGVAVGLSIMASQHLGDIPVGDAGLNLGELVIAGVTATTLIVQVIGPPMVKMAVGWAGEVGRNVTEEDVINSLPVKGVMDPVVVTVHETDCVEDLFQLFSENARGSYPVVDNRMQVCGILTFEQLRSVLPDRDCWSWIVAGDLMSPMTEHVNVNTPLREAMQLMHELQAEEMPVMLSETDREPVGLLDQHAVRRAVQEELLRRQRTGVATARA